MKKCSTCRKYRSAGASDRGVCLVLIAMVPASHSCDSYAETLCSMIARAKKFVEEKWTTFKCWW